MKQCPNCSARNDDNAAFCEGCGTDLRNVPVTPEGGPAAAGGFFDKAKEMAAAGARKAKEAASAGSQRIQQAAGQASRQRNVSAGGWDTAVETQGYTPNRGAAPQGGNSMLVDQSESIVATIGSNYLQNYLTGGSVKEGIGVLTQKRFYYKGKNYSGSGREMKSTTQEGVVSLDDVTFTMFTFVRHIGFLLVAILLTIATVVCAFVFRYGGAQIAAIPALAAIVFYVLFFVKRTSVFQVCFPGGSFGFDIKYYPIADIRDFQRQLHLLKDHIKESAAV